MRAGIIALLAVFALAAVPTAAAGATPPKWPTPADVLAVTPSLSPEDAECISKYYLGRLSRKAWLTPYYKLTRSEKIVTDKGFNQCMSFEQQAALIAREDTLAFGKHPGALRCTSRRMAARSEDLLLSITTLEEAIREDDRVYRACHLIGLLYAALGEETKLELTPAEQRCANSVGSADPIRDRGKPPTTAQREQIGAVLDRCVGSESEEAMWRRLLADFRPKKAIPCVARHSVAITFSTFFGNRPELQRATRKAAAACVLSTS
jgi:hypothetical protein